MQLLLKNLDASSLISAKVRLQFPWTSVCYSCQASTVQSQALERCAWGVYTYAASVEFTHKHADGETALSTQAVNG